MPEHYEDKSTWQRILFVALFWVIFHLVQFVLLAVAVGQCLFKLFSGNPNAQLSQLGHSLSQFVQEILAYVTFNSDRRPFPFNDFPKEGVVIEAEKSSS